MTATLERTEAVERGERRAKRGIRRAAFNRDWDIRRDELRMLELLLADPSRKVTMDDITDDLAKKIEGGGMWRGSVPRRLAEAGAIRFVRWVKSCRSKRNSGPVGEWELNDVNTAEQLRDELRAFFVAHPTRPPDDEKQTGESAVTDSPANSNITNPPNGDTEHGQAV